MSDETTQITPDNVHELLSTVMEYMYQEKGIEGVEEVTECVNAIAMTYALVEASTHDYKKDMN